MPRALWAALGLLLTGGLLLYFGGIPALVLAAATVLLVLQVLKYTGWEEESRPKSTAPSNARAPESSAQRTRARQTQLMSHVMEQTRDIVTTAIDEPDAPISSQRTLLEALEQVFDCVYAQFVSIWYDAPESIKNQPLYKFLHKCLIKAADEIKVKTAHVDKTEIMVGLIKILTLHLRKCKENKDKPREKVFKTKKDKIAFLRKYTQELITYLFPASLAESLPLILTEVLTLKVLVPTVDLLSDPDFLNQSLVELKKRPATPQLSTTEPSPTGEVQIQLPSTLSPEEQLTEEDREISNANNDDGHANSRPKKIGGILGKFKRKLKRKSEVGFRSFDEDSSEVDGNSEDGEEYGSSSKADDPSSEGSDTEESGDTNLAWGGSDLLSLLVNKMCEEWSHRNWKATVSSSPVFNEKHICTIEVQDETDHTGKSWAIKRKTEDFLSIQEILKKEFPDLFAIENILTEQNQMNSFLEVLVSIIQIQKNHEALFFLLPLDLSPEEPSEEVEPDGFESDNMAIDGINEEDEVEFRCQRETETSDEALPKALNKLLAEVCGNCLYLLQKSFTSVSKDLLCTVKENFTESKWVVYIDSLREIFWPDGKPAPPFPLRSSDEKMATKNEAEQLLLDYCSIKVIHSQWKKRAEKHFNIFQEDDQNILLICTWLKFLLDKLIPKNVQSRNIEDILPLPYHE